jgi:NADPH2:quinone reductase
MLSGLLPQVKPQGNVAAIGLAGGHRLDTTVMPFILRGVSLLGINSVHCPQTERPGLWARLATEISDQQLAMMIRDTIGLDDLPETFEKMLAGETHGRTLVELRDESIEN